jgi:hypothetical protein
MSGCFYTVDGKIFRRKCVRVLFFAYKHWASALFPSPQQKMWAEIGMSKYQTAIENPRVNHIAHHGVKPRAKSARPKFLKAARILPRGLLLNWTVHTLCPFSASFCDFFSAIILIAFSLFFYHEIDYTFRIREVRIKSQIFFCNSWNLKKYI